MNDNQHKSWQFCKEMSFKGFCTFSVENYLVQQTKMVVFSWRKIHMDHLSIVSSDLALEVKGGGGERKIKLRKDGKQCFTWASYNHVIWSISMLKACDTCFNNRGLTRLQVPGSNKDLCYLFRYYRIKTKQCKLYTLLLGRIIHSPWSMLDNIFSHSLYPILWKLGWAITLLMYAEI
jgi:hypothetical protein